MFAKAYKIARDFTFPVVLSRLAMNGECSAGIGTFVIVNSDGWIVTAYHLIEHLQQLVNEAQAASEHGAKILAIQADTALSGKERSKQISKLGQLKPGHTKVCSAWWGYDGLNIVDIHANPAADLAIARLEPFNAKPNQYPVFKDPTKNFDQGTSLCKLGYPFHQFIPMFDVAANQFTFPPQALPMPIFPIDGIFTRIAKIEVPPGGQQPAYPIMYVETSTPGLRGQSGGPTFDTNGTVWAIQSQTVHMHLGFDPPVPGGAAGQKEHQFLNVGMGVHPETIFGLFKEAGVKYEMSKY